MELNSTLPVYDIEGKEVSKSSLDKDVFDGKINKALIHQVTVMYLNNRRKGTAATLKRSEVRGGGKKPWRQKGTGRARVGSIRSPLWRGGGVIFGPHPKNYCYKLNKKIRKLAIKSMLNAKLKESKLIIIKDINLEDHKTKNFVKFLNSIKAQEKPLVLVNELTQTLNRASRNIPKVTVRSVHDVNAYDIITARELVCTEVALEEMKKRLKISPSPRLLRASKDRRPKT